MIKGIKFIKGKENTEPDWKEIEKTFRVMDSLIRKMARESFQLSFDLTTDNNVKTRLLNVLDIMDKIGFE